MCNANVRDVHNCKNLLTTAVLTLPECHIPMPILQEKKNENLIAIL
jgi:hypothetical protein